MNFYFYFLNLALEDNICACDNYPTKAIFSRPVCVSLGVVSTAQVRDFGDILSFFDTVLLSVEKANHTNIVYSIAVTPQPGFLS